MSTRLSVRWCHQIQEVDPVEWNALAGDASPFLEWEWLACLEKSGSASGKTGWLPCHLLIESGKTLVAAAPMYVKGHSQGEFIFDQEWARVAQQLGEDYYPKLVGMAPFTPATGYRILTHPDVEEATIWPVMVKAIDQFCRQQQISVCSFLHVDLDWRSSLEQSGFMPRVTHNYQWHNQGYGSYDDFLSQFNANQRRNIKRERLAMEKSGIQLKTYTGDGIPAGLYSFMYELYSNTCSQFYNWSKYLNRGFFESLDACYRERTVFIAGEQDGDVLGMSFCIHKQDRLFGRYWGCTQQVNLLHFNVCYYEPIAFAIDHQIQNFDPGAGGEHKIRRGFPATPVYSYHRFYRPRLEQVIVPYLRQVNPLMLAELDHINQNEVPFREDVLPNLEGITQR